MLTPELRSKIDALWLDFATNGLTNPLEVIEQITYLLFLRRLDDEENRRERIARASEASVQNPLFASDTQRLRWSKWPAHPEELHQLVDREVFLWMRSLGNARVGAGSSFAHNLKDARLALPSDGALLLRARNKIDEIQGIAKALDTGDGQSSYLDTMGDLYEYLLSKLATAGRNGQFRTPRHIIQMMVELVDPTPRDVICDPACGTAGFLANAARTLQERHRKAYFDPEEMAFFNSQAFVGFDLDATMVRIASMNLLLHGIENPQLERKNALGIDASFESETCDIILANPPSGQPAVRRQRQRERDRSQPQEYGGQLEEDRALVCRAVPALAQGRRAGGCDRARRRAVWRQQRAQGGAPSTCRISQARRRDLDAFRRVQALRGRLDGDLALHQDRRGRHR